jgi:hypothetical protein
MKMFSLAKEIIIEGGYMGRYEGDMISVRHFNRFKLPHPVEQTVLRVISNKINAKANKQDLRHGVYNDIEIPLFGQLIAALSGNW